MCCKLLDCIMYVSDKSEYWKYIKSNYIEQINTVLDYYLILSSFLFVMGISIFR